jgi:glycosyltransferase involved in cell wall biosynthesis
MRLLDVVIPAHDEEVLLPRCLDALLCDARDVRLRIIVAANGCSDATAAVAQTFDARARRLGHELRVVELAAAGKIGALNAADAQRRGGSVLYLDADTVLLPGSIAALVDRLDTASGPLLAAPPPVLHRPRRMLTRSFAAVWSRLPGVAGDVIGAGCYAVNAAGRRQWDAFPEVIADDLFVRGLFAPAERLVLTAGGFRLVLPEGRELIAVLGRWRRGNRELRERGPALGWRPPYAGSPGAWLRALAPSSWPHLPGFLAVTLAARWRDRHATHDRWARADDLRGEQAELVAGRIGENVPAHLVVGSAQDSGSP